MEQTQILILNGQQFGEPISRIENGSVSMNADILIRNGWRVSGTFPEGSIAMEMGEVLVYLGAYNEQAVQGE